MKVNRLRWLKQAACTDSYDFRQMSRNPDCAIGGPGFPTIGPIVVRGNE